MSNPIFVNGLIATLKAVIDGTQGVTDTTKTWWNNRLDTTLAGHDWARNPEGFFLKGIAPATKRNPDKVIAQFRLGLQMGLTSNMEKSARTVGSPLANASIEAGLFQSFARKNSQYGSESSRKDGNLVSKTAETGANVGPIVKSMTELEKSGHTTGNSPVLKNLLSEAINKAKKDLEAQQAPPVVKPAARRARK